MFRLLIMINDTTANSQVDIFVYHGKDFSSVATLLFGICGRVATSARA